MYSFSYVLLHAYVLRVSLTSLADSRNLNVNDVLIFSLITTQLPVFDLTARGLSRECPKVSRR